MIKSKVAISAVARQPNEDEIAAGVREAVEGVGGLDGVRSGDLVLIKPNICAPAKPGSAVYTDPLVSKAVADMVRERGGRAVIGESSGVADNTEEAIEADGYGRLREKGYEVIDLKRKGIETVKVPVPQGKAMKEVTLPRIVLDADMIITVPVMKTHAAQNVTLALKNLKGLIPDALKKKFHTTYGVAQGMVDLLTVAKPGLAVMDGIVAQEGMGPVLGTPVELGIIIAGKDAVAVDTVAATIMGFDVREVPIIVGAGEAGLGVADLNSIEIVGVPLEKVSRRFKRFNEAIMETLHFPKDFRLVINEKACTGCRESVLAAMYGLNCQNSLEMLEGWTILAGHAEDIPEVDKSRLMIVGNCITKYKKLGVFVPGCPPDGAQVINALKGENPRWR